MTQSHFPTWNPIETTLSPWLFARGLSLPFWGGLYRFPQCSRLARVFQARWKSSIQPIFNRRILLSSGLCLPRKLTVLFESLLSLMDWRYVIFEGSQAVPNNKHASKRVEMSHLSSLSGRCWKYGLPAHGASAAPCSQHRQLRDGRQATIPRCLVQTERKVWVVSKMSKILERDWLYLLNYDLILCISI